MKSFLCFVLLFINKVAPSCILQRQCSYKYVFTAPNTVFHGATFVEEVPLKLTLLDPEQSNINQSIQRHHGEIKRLHRNCENVLISLSEQTDLSVIDSHAFKIDIHEGQRLLHDHFVFVCSSARQRQHVVSLGWVQRLKYSSVVIQGENHLLYESRKSPLCNEDTSGVSIKKELAGRELKDTAFTVEPYVILRNGSPIGGYFYELLVHAAKVYNFTYHLEFPVLNGITQLPNGTFLGPMGEVISGQTDAILGAAQTLERFNLMDFPTYADTAELLFVTSRPMRRLNPSALFCIFTAPVWLLLLLSACAMTAIFYGFMDSGQNITRKAPADIFHTFLLAINTLLEQDTSSSAKIIAPHSRLFVFFWMVISMIIVTYYKSDFVAHLTAPAKQKVPETYQELSENTKYRINFMFLNAGATYFFNRSENPLYTSLRKRFNYENDKIKCVQSAALDPKSVCIAFKMFLDTLIAKNLTLRRDFRTVQYSKDAAITVGIHMAFTKGSKYVDSFNNIVGRLRDTGNIVMWKQRAYEIRKTESIEWLQSTRNNVYGQLEQQLYIQSNAKYRALGLNNVLSGFLMLGIGLSVAVASFAAELIRNKLIN